jgi:hypothetical protein
VSTNPPTQPPARPPVAAYREVIGLFVLMLGLALILVAAYRTDLELGIALTGVLGAGVGAWLTIGEGT